MSKTTSDISSQIDDLRLLKDGWLEGQGKGPSQEGLDWLAVNRRHSTSITQMIYRCLISIQRNRVVFKRSGR